MSTNEDPVLAAARSLGLDKAAKDFPADVAAAAAAARMFREGLGVLPDPTSEPWPPMRVAVKA